MADEGLMVRSELVDTTRSAEAVRGGQGQAGRVGGIIGGSLRLDSPAKLAEIEEARAFLAGRQELGLEIGFGDGSFLRDVAAANPERRFFGLEVKRKLVLQAREALAAAKLDNVAVLEGDARVLLPRLMSPGSLRQIWILFPDPWWKQRQWLRRTLVTSPFSGLLTRYLAAGGVLTCKTDVPAMAEQMAGVFDRQPGLARTEADGLRVPQTATTKRERRCGHERTPFEVMRWRRTDEPLLDEPLTVDDGAENGGDGGGGVNP